MGIKYDTNTIQLINLFESVSSVKVKDCLVNENIIFIVNKGYMGKAIGRNGVKIKNHDDLSFFTFISSKESNPESIVTRVKL